MPKQNLVNLARHSNNIVPVPALVPLYAKKSAPDGTYTDVPDTAHPATNFLSRQYATLADDAYLLFTAADLQLNGVFLEDHYVRLTNHGSSAIAITAVKWVPTASRTITCANAAKNDTVTIGDKTYTFKATLSEKPTAYEVKLGATDAEDAANLVAAINGTAEAGTTYGAGTPAHPSVYASANGAVVTIMPRYLKPTDDSAVKTGLGIYFTTSDKDHLAVNGTNTSTIAYTRILTWTPVVLGHIVLCAGVPLDLYLPKYHDFRNETNGTVNISIMILE